MNKQDIQDLLTEAGIEFSEEMTKPELQALIDENSELFEDDSEDELGLPEGHELLELKLRKRHPKKSLRLGRHVVKVSFEAFILNEEELKELESVGCKHWIISKKEFEETKK